MLLVILCFFLVSDGPVIFLSSGKAIDCERFEKKGQTVELTRNGQVFSLPLAAVDWKRTEQENERRQRARADAASSTPKQAPVAPRRDIVFTNDDLDSTAGTKTQKVPYRLIGNSIIVPVTINGSGPYNVILDTGAALTVLDPAVMTQLKIPFTGHSIPMVGVGGEVRSPTAVLGEIGIESAVVTDLEVAAFRIDALSEAGTVGLLGQDYLKKFVMELDSANKILSLTPHEIVESEHFLNMSPRDVQQRISDLERKTIEFQGALRTLGNVYEELAQSNGTSKPRVQVLSEVGRTITEFRIYITQTRRLFSSIPSDEMTDQMRDDVSDYVQCFGTFDHFLRDLERFNQKIRRSCAKSDPAGDLPGLRRDLTDLIDLYGDVKGCK